MPNRPLASAFATLLLCVSLAGCSSIQLTMARRWSEPGPVAVPADITVERDLVYAEAPSGPLLLDLYRPAVRSGDVLPVVVFLHGGGWFIGNKHQLVRVDGQHLARDGYAVVSANYRLTGVASHPAQIHDAKTVIRWVRAHAGEYGLDARRIGVWGGSAGGHLASLLGTSGGVASLEGDAGNAGDRAWPGYSSRVQAVVNYFGITNLETMANPQPPSDVELQDTSGMITNFLGGPLEMRREAARAASPVTWVDPTDPPFLHVHGDRDPIVPYAQALELDARLRRAGVASTLHTVEGGGHGRGGEFGSDALATHMRAFFDRHLKR